MILTPDGRECHATRRDGRPEEAIASPRTPPPTAGQSRARLLPRALADAPPRHPPRARCPEAQGRARGARATRPPSSRCCSVSFDDADPIDLDGVQALIATSRNGLRALEVAPGAGGGAAICRCSPSARRPPTEARALGFEMVVTGAGTAQELVAHIVSVVDPCRRAAAASGRRDAGRRPRGRARDRTASACCSRVVYRMRRRHRAVGGHGRAAGDGRDRRRHPVVAAHGSGYATLMRKQGLATIARGLQHFCLSQAVARRLEPLGTLRVADCRAARSCRSACPDRCGRGTIGRLSRVVARNWSMP